MRIDKLSISFSVFLLCSCATIIDKRYQNINFNTNYINAKVKVNDSIYSLPENIKVKRSSKALLVTLISDDTLRTFKVKSSISALSIFGNLGLFYYAPAGIIIDLISQKGFSYASNIFIHKEKESNTVVSPFKSFYKINATNTDDKKEYSNLAKHFFEINSIPKGQVNFIFGLPYVNSFFYRPLGESEVWDLGYIGISGGIEYFYKTNRFFNLNASGVMNYPTILPQSTYFTKNAVLTSGYVSLTNNFKINRFTFGYGINYCSNNWIEVNSDSNIERPTKNLGFTFNSYFNFFPYMYIGLIYRPTVFRIQPRPDFLYEHLISVDFAWKLKIKS